MAAQFFRVEVFALKSVRGKRCVADIIAEVARASYACTHVTDPKSPTVVWGRHPAELLEVIASQLDGARDRLGRRVPKTFPVLAAAVASYPAKSAEIESDPDRMTEIARWVAANIDFFKGFFGDALESIVLHADEQFIHIHCYAVPYKHPTSGIFTIESIWPPLAAQGEQRRRKASKTEKLGAFKREASRAQDRYFEIVSARCALSRVSVRRQRLPREVRLAQKKQENALMNAHEALDRRKAAIDEEVARKVAANKATTIRVATDEINRANQEAARRLRSAKSGVLALSERLKLLEANLRFVQADADRLRSLLREHGVDPEEGCSLHG